MQCLLRAKEWHQQKSDEVTTHIAETSQGNDAEIETLQSVIEACFSRMMPGDVQHVVRQFTQEEAETLQR